MNVKSIFQLAGLPGFDVAAGARRILVVEDEPIWQSIYRRALERIDEKLEVMVAEDADEALAMNRDYGPFDLIISDQYLSKEGTGLDLWDRLAGSSRMDRAFQAELPFVLISSIRPDEFLKQWLPYGREEVPQYIQKPKSIGEVSQVMRGLLDPDFCSNSSSGMIPSAA